MCQSRRIADMTPSIKYEWGAPDVADNAVVQALERIHHLASLSRTPSIKTNC